MRISDWSSDVCASDLVADHLGCPESQVFVSSTGVIGVPLPKDKAREGVTKALVAAPCSWEDAASTIATTDTFPKGATAAAMIGDTRVTISAIIKGRSEEHTSALQSLMRTSYAVFFLKKTNKDRQ